MENKPKLIIYEEQIFNVGEDTFIFILLLMKKRLTLNPYFTLNI